MIKMIKEDILDVIEEYNIKKEFDFLKVNNDKLQKELDEYKTLTYVFFISFVILIFIIFFSY